ncbi:MAG: tetratricopeptide repeat protein [Bacteroidales bacterium]|nr:tetratricopeptide repeat protein [Bacteroidales bacterium]
MKKFLLTCLFFCLLGAALSRAQYIDHRDHELDSLERFVIGWTPERIAASDDEDCTALAEAYSGLMWGYMQINPDRGLFFGRKLLALGIRKDWLWRQFDANRVIGQYHYAKGQYDSAFFYYNAAQAVIDRMPGRYEQANIDDVQSQLYGTVGNLYNVLDSIPKAMEYYRKAGEIFERYGWLNNSSVLYHNMGETYLEAGDLQEAGICYEKALQYGQEAADSLLIADALSGLGALYLEEGRTYQALRHLQEADAYYSTHQDQEFGRRIEALDLIGRVLKAQKRQLWAMVAGGFVIILLLTGFVLLLLRSRRLRKEKDAADEVIDQALEQAAPRIVLENDADLTDREREILPLLAEGLTSNQIADRLYLSQPTIKWYRRRLLDRFDAKNTAEMLSKAREQGLL